MTNRKAISVGHWLYDKYPVMPVIFVRCTNIARDRLKYTYNLQLKLFLGFKSIVWSQKETFFTLYETNANNSVGWWCSTFLGLVTSWRKRLCTWSNTKFKLGEQCSWGNIIVRACSKWWKVKTRCSSCLFVSTKFFL